MESAPPAGSEGGRTVVERFAHTLTGWVEFEVEGNGPRFLNAAAKSGVEFWAFRREGGRVVARGRPAEYKRLRGISRRCGARPRLRARGGLPFLLARLWRCKGLALGALGGAAVYGCLSCFCWGVTITGAETLTPAQVLEAARQSGVAQGVLLASLDPKGAALSLQNSLEGVTWLSVNTEGCFVEISLRESLPKPQVADDREWSNIVAARAGTVLSVEAERGRPVVAVGETVEAGQMLIAGLYEQEVDPYSPPPEDPYQVLGAARGSVRALTYREFTVEVPQQSTRLVPQERQRQAFFTVFGLRIPLGLYAAPQQPARSWTQRRVWSPLGRELPLAWEEQVYEPLEEEAVLLGEEQWQQAALLALRRQQREELPPGSRVVEEQLSYSYQDGVCVLRAQCRCEEEIALVRRISFE